MFVWKSSWLVNVAIKARFAIIDSLRPISYSLLYCRNAPTHQLQIRMFYCYVEAFIIMLIRISLSLPLYQILLYFVSSCLVLLILSHITISLVFHHVVNISLFHVYVPYIHSIISKLIIWSSSTTVSRFHSISWLHPFWIWASVTIEDSKS